MTLVIVVVILAGALWLWAATRSRPSRDFGSSGSVVVHIDQVDPATITGEMEKADYDHWRLFSKLPIPLTIGRCAMEAASDIRSTIIRTAKGDNAGLNDLAYLLAQHNVRCHEVEALRQELQPSFRNSIAEQIAASPEWSGANDADRADLRSEFEERACASLPIFTGNVDLAEFLSSEPPADATVDDALLARFGSDTEAYALYLSEFGGKKAIATISADHYQRKVWERLVAMGFARRGAAISSERILQSLSLKDLNAIANRGAEKPFARKAKAIEYLQSLADLSTRIARHVGLRELFELLPIEGVDLEAARASYRHAGMTAMLMVETERTGYRSLQRIAEAKVYGPVEEWEVTQDEDPLPACAAKYCKTYKRRPARIPPYHVGCTCWLETK